MNPPPASPPPAKPAGSTPAPANASRSHRQNQPRAWRRLVPWIIGAGVAGFIVFGLRPRPLEVETATISSGPLTVSVLEEGKTRIRHRHLITAPVGGMLQRVEWRAGARIEAGKTVLAALVPEPSSFLNPRAKAEAEARLQAAEAVRMQRGTQLDRARDALSLADKEFERAKVLRRTGAIATREWDAAQNQVDLLNREVNTAGFALKVAEFESAQAKAALMQSESTVPDQSAPYQILAPVNGFVLNVMEESARVVTPGMPIMEVGDPTDLEAEIELLSSDAVGVQPGAEVSIEQWGGGGPLRGKVSLVEPGGFTKISALGVEEQRVKVRVDFAEPLPAGLLVGDRYRVEARIVTWHSDNVLQVPTGALFRRGGEWMTFLAEGGTARRTAVKIKHNNGIAAEIESGLTAGQSVILHPPDALEEGVKIEPRR
ncbi:MAG: efflux transporter, family, subunit [Verrucomicrobiales bacterium]|nr:efflux transporter, family, subunit [Verrucomicrobiales bacterium]